MNRLLLIALGMVLFVVFGCSNKDKVPSGTLPKEKMEAVLWDILQAERFTSTYVSKDSSKNVKLENFKMYNQVFAIHQVSRDEFVKSYKFYLSRPDIARVLFDSMATRANRQREDMYKSQTQPAKTDSTKPAQPAQPAHKDSVAPKSRLRDLIKPGAHGPIIMPDTGKAVKPLNRLRPPNLRIRDSILRRRTNFTN